MAHYFAMSRALCHRYIGDKLICNNLNLNRKFSLNCLTPSLRGTTTLLMHRCPVPLSATLQRFVTDIHIKNESSSATADLPIATTSLDASFDVEVLLKGVTDNTALKAMKTLLQWQNRQKIDFKKDVENSKDFEKLCKALKRRQKYLYGITDCIRSLVALDCLLTQHKVLESLQNDLLWKQARCKIPALICIMELQLQFPLLPLRKQVLEECINNLERRWVEMCHSSEIVFVYTHYKIFGPTFLARIDNLTVERSQDWSADGICRVLCLLGSTKRRAVPILRALAYHCTRTEDVLSSKLAANALHACKVLNFYDTELLKKLSMDIVAGMATDDKPNVFATIMISMGQMKLRDDKLLDACSMWLESNMDLCKVSDFVSYILTLAIVDYLPANGNAILDMLLPKLTLDSVPTEKLWLDVVWSLLVLDRATKEHLEVVLDVSFRSKLESHPNFSIYTLRKLRNITEFHEILHGQSVLTKSAKEWLKTAKPNLMIADNSKNPPKSSKSDDDQSQTLLLSDQIVKTLSLLFPPPQYMTQAVNTTFGESIDAVFAIDSAGKALSLSQVGGVQEKSSSVPAADGGGHRVACVVWNYKDYCLGSYTTPRLTGANQLFVRWLQNKQYKVLQMPHYEYNVRNNTLTNAKFLQEKIYHLQ